MNFPRAGATGCPERGRRTLRSIPLAGAAGACLLVVAGGCGGPLSWRSVAEFAADVPIPAGVKTVRIEIQNGTVGVDVGPAGTVTLAGGVLRAADTKEELERLEQIPPGLRVVPDPQRPDTLVLRGPDLPAQAQALYAFELRAVRVPADLALEIAVEANGHAMVRNREAAIEVTTGRGDLRFEDCRGSLSGRTNHGNVIVVHHRGDIALRTDHCDMQAFVREAGTQLQLVTGGGTVQCLVPADLEFDVDARAETGKIGNGFGLPVTKPNKYSAVMVGKRGSARTQVVLRTGEGALSFAPNQFN
jgi:hypothetical protein